jgi:hypothetical protein
MIEGEQGARPKVLAGERLRLLLTQNGTEILLEGRMLSPRPIPGRADRIHAGIQFQNVATGIEGRQTFTNLSRIVGLLQREEARRNRLGLKIPA